MAQETYKENTLCCPPRRLVVPLREGDELVCHSLGLLGLGICRLDGLELDQGGDHVAEEGFSVG